MGGNAKLHPIHALWAHPRSMSTALERVMRERGDLDCVHEPFMYDYYINRQERRMPMFDPEPGHPVTYSEVRAMLLERAARGPVFFKDMSYYVMPHLLQDGFCDQITHAFLVRDPEASIVSYHKLDPNLSCIEIGLEAQWQIYEALCARGAKPVVLRSEDVRADPVGVISAYWQAVGLKDKPLAFTWSDETPQDWQQVAGWHGAVMDSRAIRPLREDHKAQQSERFEKAAREAPQVRDMLDHHRPFYDKFCKIALTAD